MLATIARGAGSDLFGFVWPLNAFHCDMSATHSLHSVRFGEMCFQFSNLSPDHWPKTDGTLGLTTTFPNTSQKDLKCKEKMSQGFAEFARRRKRDDCAAVPRSKPCAKKKKIAPTRRAKSPDNCLIARFDCESQPTILPSRRAAIARPPSPTSRALRCMSGRRFRFRQAQEALLEPLFTATRSPTLEAIGGRLKVVAL